MLWCDIEIYICRKLVISNLLAITSRYTYAYTCGSAGLFLDYITRV